MAVYTTFFAATDAELKAAFTGWLAPLPTPVKRTRMHPVTKKAMTYDSWEPDDASKAPASPPNRVLVSGEGDHAGFAHTRLPMGVQALPHLAAKSVLPPHVEQLLGILAGRTEERLRPALFPPGGSATGTTLDVLPDWGVEAVAMASNADLPRFAETMASSDGWFADEGWPADACADLLHGLRRIAVDSRTRHGCLYY
jgi:hypothetical protein